MEKDIKKKFILFAFDADPKQREVGDDAGVFYYALAWFYVGIVLVFFSDPAFDQVQNKYLFFDVVAILFMVLYLWRTPNKKLNLPNLPMLLQMVAVTSFCIFIMVILGYFLQMILGQAFSLKFGVFEFFRIIPVEEMAFRGLGMELFLLLGGRVSKKSEVKWISLSDSQLIKSKISENKFFIIGGISNSIMFGLLHFRAYPDQIYPLIYLIILGLIASYLRFKFGMISSMMLHGFNNVIASWTGALFI